MQSQLGKTQGLEIHILGVNGVGLESGNGAITSGHAIPWLQDTAEQSVWTKWQVTYRDVIILDAENRPAAVYNLTTYDLSVQANYDSLRTLLMQVAE